MGKYFVVQITKTKDSGVYATAVTPRDSEKEAEMLWHQIMASVLADSTIEYAQVYVDDYAGNKVFLRTIYPSPEPTPEE